MHKCQRGGHNSWTAEQPSPQNGPPQSKLMKLIINFKLCPPHGWVERSLPPMCIIWKLCRHITTICWPSVPIDYVPNSIPFWTYRTDQTTHQQSHIWGLVRWVRPPSQLISSPNQKRRRCQKMGNKSAAPVDGLFCTLAWPGSVCGIAQRELITSSSWGASRRWK